VEESAFFVTNSQAVLDKTLETIPGLEKVCCIDGIACDQSEAVSKEFNQCLMHLAKNPWTGPDQVVLPDFNSGAGKKINLKLYILPEADSQAFCNFFLKDKI
jgi:hypothetical protein